ncbi:uncharacterized protein BCR38DRAFT_505334 [Pseudomassariella vexata]|uniref:NACHT domain-containing protein n=1 Tax=Pseudomassariella vexata TaxID=1141098 RepID=A0A1Y2DAV4_9PEZI|nr:uncharacterized protein BCR38DRAFT_505334 [Pseudomassariella vexata]ORY56389.1 hypothetical protein BCR38DRAFT_505334 [Pseudomassariella vexata]
MKDPSVRDRLSKEMDVLCLEMEAAGLMNHFPCLVIRGICDYSDTHKNKEWQGYAAMAAAAYAKDLLNRTAPNRVEAEKKLTKVIDEGFAHGYLKGVHSLASASQSGVESLKVDKYLEKLRNWLSPPDLSTNYNKALEQRNPGSGQWFLQIEAYKAWKREPNFFLWLNGIPGCGKTVLSSTVFENLEKIEACSQNLLYFYFDFTNTEKHSFEKLICSLIHQLYYKSEKVRRYLDSPNSSFDNGRRRPSIDLLSTTLQNMLQQAGEVWIVLDALDECKTRKYYPTGGLLPWIRNLRDLQTNIHLLITSRPEQDIKETVEKLARNKDIISLQSDLIEDDICGYIRARVKQSEGLSRWHERPDMQSKIEATLVEKANGMFRWVSCQFDVLEHCYSPQEVEMVRATLPATLDETYARILENIPPNHMHYAKRLLQFLSFSERPLRIDEAVDAIAVDTASRPRFDPQNGSPIPEISKYCYSLVVLFTKKSNPYKDEMVTEIQLAHFSVKEYLTSNRLAKSIKMDFEEAAARASISEACLAYLLDLDQTCKPQEIIKSYPMAQYSAQYWTSHAIIAETHSETGFKLAIEFFSCKDSIETCLELYDIG